MTTESEQWWIANFGDVLIWARLRLLPEGKAEILDYDGKTHSYPDEDTACMALLDAEFRAFEGLDEEDANEMGFSLQEVFPPEAEDEESLISLMAQRLARKN